MNDELTSRLAQLKLAHENGILNEATYQAAVAAISSAGITAHQSGSGSIATHGRTSAGERGVAVRGDVEGGVFTGAGAAFTEEVEIDGDFVNRDKIIYQVYQSAPGPARLNEGDFQRILGDYLGWVQRTYARARLYGLESMRTAKGRPVRTLAQVFVPLSLRHFAPPERRQIEKMAREFDGDPLAKHRAYVALVDQQRQDGVAVKLADLLTISSRLAVIGGAGSGKSTLLSYLACALAEYAQANRRLSFALPTGMDAPVPLLIPLRYYRQYQEACRSNLGRSLDDPRSGTLAGFLPWHLKRRSPALELSQDFFDRLLLGGGCLVMLDGLDELVDQTERGQMRAQVEKLANDIYPGNHFVVTAREAGYRENAVFGDDFVRLDVQPLADGEIAALVQNWCEQIYPQDVAHRRNEIVWAIEQINQRYRQQKLPPLITTPLMTTIVISVKWGETELPRERAKLYESAVKVILQGQYLDEDESREALVNWGGPWDEQLAWLAHLALGMHQLGKAGAALDEDGVRALLAARLDPPTLDAFLKAVRVRGGLLEERGELFQFLHLTFQEFMAARLLAKEREDSWPVLGKNVGDPWWREVFLLHYGFAKTDYDRYAEQFLNWLSRIPDGDTTTELAGLELAGAAVLEIERLEPELRRRQAQRLAEFLFAEETHAHTSPELRLAAARTLDRLGDPRPGVGLRADGLPDMEWVKIPERDSQGRAEFIYGEKGQPRIEPTFWMARYPVTYAQFQAFVDDPEGIQNPRWWQGLAKMENRAYEQNVKFGNHPRDNVTWYQAVAFCHWLMEQAKREPTLLPPDVQNGKWRITLPTEWQWEKAARGHDGRAYPWGPNYIQGYANVWKDGPHYLQSTSAVGLYPLGASPFVILDLSGNVWEWCLNEYGNPGRIQESGENGRVLRGGSWFWNVHGALASARYWDYLLKTDQNFGFRVVVVPVSHGR